MKETEITRNVMLCDFSLWNWIWNNGPEEIQTIFIEPKKFKQFEWIKELLLQGIEELICNLK